jgi:hypothetical protein
MIAFSEKRATDDAVSAASSAYHSMKGSSPNEYPHSTSCRIPTQTTQTHTTSLPALRQRAIQRFACRSRLRRAYLCDLRREAPIRDQPGRCRLIILTIKGTFQRARVAAQAHGIQLIAVTQHMRCEETFSEALCRDTFSKAVQAWYVSTDHTRPYEDGDLLWHRKSVLCEPPERRLYA